MSLSFFTIVTDLSRSRTTPVAAMRKSACRDNQYMWNIGFWLIQEWHPSISMFLCCSKHEWVDHKQFNTPTRQSLQSIWKLSCKEETHLSSCYCLHSQEAGALRRDRTLSGTKEEKNWHILFKLIITENTLERSLITSAIKLNLEEGNKSVLLTSYRWLV